MENIVASSTVLGAIVGLILALTGAGGAILAVPLLLFVLHLSVAEAAPVALLAVGLSAAVGAVIGLRAGIVRYRAAMLMAVTGTVFSPAGLWLAHRLPNGPLTLLFAAVLAFVALRMFRQATVSTPHRTETGQHLQPCQLDNDTGRFVWTASCTRALALSGIGAGFLSGLLGVGGGFVIVPALKKATNAPLHSIVATCRGCRGVLHAATSPRLRAPSQRLAQGRQTQGRTLALGGGATAQLHKSLRYIMSQSLMRVKNFSKGARVALIC